jgi:hypothetical protein
MVVQTTNSSSNANADVHCFAMPHQQFNAIAAQPSPRPSSLAANVSLRRSTSDAQAQMIHSYPLLQYTIPFYQSYSQYPHGEHPNSLYYGHYRHASTLAAQLYGQPQESFPVHQCNATQHSAAVYVSREPPRVEKKTAKRRFVVPVCLLVSFSFRFYLILDFSIPVC